MISASYFKPFIAATAVLSLSGCLGLGSSGGGGAAAGAGGGAKPASFSAAFDKTSGLGPSTKPITGKANYEGQVEVRTNANANNAKEAVFGDLKMAIDFAPNVQRPISGTVGNFAGKVDGKDTKITGTLSTANAKLSDPNAITVQTDTVGQGPLPPGVVIPPQAVGTKITSTGMSATFTGDLVDPESLMTGKAQLIVQGTFTGDTGQGIIGGAGGSVVPSSGPAFIVGGQAYANRK